MHRRSLPVRRRSRDGPRRTLGDSRSSIRRGVGRHSHSIRSRCCKSNSSSFDQWNSPSARSSRRSYTRCQAAECRCRWCTGSRRRSACSLSLRESSFQTVGTGHPEPRMQCPRCRSNGGPGLQDLERTLSRPRRLRCRCTVRSSRLDNPRCRSREHWSRGWSRSTAWAHRLASRSDCCPASASSSAEQIRASVD